jgi:hypothetical protein
VLDAEVCDEIERLAARTDGFLWSAAEVTSNALPSSGKRLIFPVLHSGRLRVSEQEARFYFVQALEESPFVYSIESPTEKLYRQKGNAPSKAAFDTTVKDVEGRCVVNCEFKCGGISVNRLNRMSVAKDLEKLLRDPGDGLWFHLLKAVNNSTLSYVLMIIGEELGRLRDEYRSEIQSKTLVMHICILRPRFSIHRAVALHPDLSHSELMEGFKCSYAVTRRELRNCSANHGWSVGFPPQTMATGV